MSKIWLPGGGGGGDGSDDCTIVLPDVPKGLKAVTSDSDDEAREGTLDTAATAADSHVLDGETYMKFNQVTKHWEKRTGAQTNRGAWTGRIGVNGKIAIPAGNHNGAGYVDQAITDRGAWTGSVGMNSAVTVPEGYHSGGGKVNGPAVTQRDAWTSALGVNGKVAIPAGYHNGSGYVNQSLATKGAQTYTPGRTNQVIAANQYLTGPQTIAGDANLLAGNIKKNVSIMGIIGSYQGYTDSPLYLYNNGVWSNLQTTGMNNTTPKGGVLFVDTTIGKAARLNQTVDLTAYNYIKVSARLPDADTWTASFTIGVSTKSTEKEFGGTGIPTWARNRHEGNAFAIGILNVSSLTGFYYIYVGSMIAQRNNITVYQSGEINQIFLSVI